MRCSKLVVLVLLQAVSVGRILSIQDFPALNHLRSRTPVQDQQQAAQDLITRVLKEKAIHFKAQIIENKSPDFRDTVNLLSDGNLVTVSGTSGVAVAMGFYYYLKTYCGCQYTWAGEQLSLPSPLPVIQNPGKTVTTNDRFRYYQNVCTASYSFAFWNWTRWERHIDWMAMNGINLPLAFTGQEAIFQRVYQRLGFSFEDLQHHFGGPAFLAWARMGNIDGWGGPLPQYWIDEQLTLQHKILARMRSLGMLPVLPGFAGHVPPAITRIYPNASVSKLRDWGNFNSTYCCTYLLDFHDPLFKKIGSQFIMEMQTEFGVDHVYNADSFNEMTPKSSDPAYLRSAGRSVFEAMTAADPQAVWLMQGWLFLEKFWQPPQVESLLTSVPKGRMILLDLMAELHPIYTTTKSFYGQPFIWCMLHNFGGTMELYGDITAVNTGPFVGRTATNTTMIGIGMTPEGIFQNEVMYEFMAENTWAEKPRNLSQWMAEFSRKRYGNTTDDIVSAWLLLKRSVYNNTDGMRDHSDYVVPTFHPDLNPPLHPDVWYDPKDLHQAWDHMIAAASQITVNSLFKYDLTDITRNVLQLQALQFYHQLVAAYNNRNMTDFLGAAGSLLQVLYDFESILATDPHFLLGNWLRDARSKGSTPEESDLMEYNARNQITLWGPRGEISDYAAKQWSGLMRDYYKPRWSLFISTLKNCLKTGTKFDRNAFDQRLFLEVEQPFTFAKNKYPTEPIGDTIDIARILHHNYMYRDYSAVHVKTFREQLKWRKPVYKSVFWQYKH